VTCGASAYQPRPVTAYGVETINGWPTKVYGLAVQGRPSAELVAAARTLARDVLPAGEATGVAFVIAHQAKPACFVLVYWWATSVDLCLQYYRSPLDRPTELEPLPANSAGCVWELALAEHERSTWVRHLLTAEPPSLEAYLTTPAPTEV
jgi:hypothetical protein